VKYATVIKYHSQRVRIPEFGQDFVMHN